MGVAECWDCHALQVWRAGGRDKHVQYWPTMESRPFTTGCYVVKCTAFNWNDSCISSLKLHDLETGNTCTVHYFSWPDFGIPQNPLTFLQFLLDVRGSWCNQRVILHCNARIGRSGVFCLTDVCMSWMEGEGVCTHWILSVFSFTYVSRDWTDSDPWTATIRLLNCPECSSLCIGAGSENSWSAERCEILHKTLREADAKCPHAV